MLNKPRSMGVNHGGRVSRIWGDGDANANWPSIFCHVS